MDSYEEIIADNRSKEINPVLFGWHKNPPCHSFGPFIRTHWLLHYITKGKGIFIRDGKTHHLGEGDMFIIPPGQKTYYEADKDDPWYYTWIGFTSTLDMPYFKENHFLHIPAVSEVFTDMKRCRDFENGRAAFLCGHIWEILSIILERGKKHTNYVDRAINYMRIGYMNPISVSSIAQHLNISRNYLALLFKEETGMSPQSYLIKIRLEAAVTLMTELNERPINAAASVGYPDFYHFSKIFKQYYGVSPREYVRRYKENIIQTNIKP